MERDTIKKVLKAARENKGLSNAALAKEVGISASTYNMYELGGSIPRNMDVLKRICSVLDISLEALGFYEPESDYEVIDKIHKDTLLKKYLEAITSIMNAAFELTKEYNQSLGYNYELDDEQNEALGHVEDKWISQSFYFDLTDELEALKKREERKMKLTRHIVKILTRSDDIED